MGDDAKSALPYDVIGHSSRVDEWLALRRTGIGASEAHRLWSSPYALWCEKSGLVEPEDLGGVEAVEWGHHLEPVVARVAAARMGRAHVLAGDLLRSTSEPWAVCTLDAWVSESGDRWPLEIKTASAYKADDWKEGPPPQYAWQLQQQMLVTGAARATIACLLGGQRLVWCDVDRDDGMIRTLVKAGAEMWRRVQENDPPDADGSEATARALKQRYPRHEDGVVLTLDEDAMRIAESLDAAKAARSELDDAIARDEARIKALLGTAEKAVLPDGSGFSFKASERAGYTVAPTTVRTLRRTQPRKER
jgi:putative phage-type endonuclease